MPSDITIGEAALVRISGILGCDPSDVTSGRVEITEYREIGNNQFYLSYLDTVRGPLSFRGVLDTAQYLMPQSPSPKGPFLSEGARAVAVRIQVELERFRGMTLKDFACLANIDHRTIGQHVIEIGSGSTPRLPAGKIPVRRFGTKRRIFLADVFGIEEHGGAHHDCHLEDTTPTATSGPSWSRSLGHLLEP